MKMKTGSTLCILIWLFMLTAHILDAQELNAPKSRFRGVWIATVRNLDWPSRPGIPVEQMKEEYRKHLDLLQSLGMNAVIVQVRPSGDAMYPSALEPWSMYLSGKQGVPPPGGFDPLQFMINETHARAMEFHAWFNPFRGVRDADAAELAKGHIYHRHPEWFLRYGDHLYFDPGNPGVRKFCRDVILDVVRRYDIDAIHFDDYYYPYRIEGEEFPDAASFEAYGASFYPGAKDDWRRENINRFVQSLHDSLEVIKPWVHFGISPFGVWRNKSRDPRGSDTETLQTNYDDLYGDALKWVNEGWLDYILPQCYQYLGRDIMDYRAVTQWWNENHGQVNFFIGQSPYRLGRDERGEPWTRGNEIARQLVYHDSVPDLKGSAFFRSSTFFGNPLGLNDLLKEQFFRYPAIPPPSHHDMDRENDQLPRQVAIRVQDDSLHINWKVDRPELIRWYVVYGSEDLDDPSNILLITASQHADLSAAGFAKGTNDLYLTSIDRYRIESPPARIRVVLPD